MLYGKPLFTAVQIRKRVEELGNQITADYNGEELLIVGVLKGTYMLLADLSRAIKLPITVDFLALTNPTNDEDYLPRIITDLREEIRNKNVLLVKDIVHKGETVEYLRKSLLLRQPKSLKVCTLLNKVEGRKKAQQLDYIGFHAPDKFLVGYGLDYQDKYRNLPYLATLEKK
ncbi:MAG: hypoxanthine phosphoribosyltransferase [Nitrospirota bacterium]|nr:hypoxanthine phosphoribosyltransferase [Nitrospirota bacterium]